MLSIFPLCYNKYMNKERRTINKRTIIIIASILAAILLIILIIPKQSEFPLTDQEHSMLEEKSASYINYLEEIDHNSDNLNPQTNPSVNDIPLDSYIAFAMECTYNEKDQNSLTTEEIKSFLKSTFEIDVDTDKLNNVGVTPYLLNKNIGHSMSSQTYTISKEADKIQIAGTPFAKYIEKSSSTNRGRTEFTVVYDKYTINNPYDIIPYIDTSDAGINAYLQGKGKIAPLKNAITAESLTKLGEPEKQTTVVYAIKDNDLIIKSIK